MRMATTLLLFAIGVYAIPVYDWRCIWHPPGAAFQARLLDNLEGNTERYMRRAKALWLILVNADLFGADTCSDCGDIEHGKSHQGRVMVWYTPSYSTLLPGMYPLPLWPELERPFVHQFQIQTLFILRDKVVPYYNITRGCYILCLVWRIMLQSSLFVGSRSRSQVPGGWYCSITLTINSKNNQ